MTLQEAIQWLAADHKRRRIRVANAPSDDPIRMDNDGFLMWDNHWAEMVAMREIMGETFTGWEQ